MQYKGSMSLPRLTRQGYRGKTVGKLIEPQFRAAAKQTFFMANALALHDLALKIPVLTGTTRGAVVTVMKRAESEFLRAGGWGLNLSPISMALTLAKMDSEDNPMPGDKQYKRRYDTDTSSDSYGSRSEWASVETSNFVDVEAVPSVAAQSGYGGIYTFYFDIRAPHWDEYDQVGIQGPLDMHGPWHVMDRFPSLVEEELESRLPALANHFAGMIVEGAQELDAYHPVQKTDTSTMALRFSEDDDIPF